MNSPIVFLDMDGVLNSDLFIQSDRFDKKSEREFPNYVDPLAAEILNNFLQDTNADLVISSTWRIHYTPEEFEAGLIESGVSRAEGKLLGFTPRDPYHIRGVEVKRWLSDHIPNRNFGHYVIFDDDSDFLISQQPHLFMTDTYVGLTPNTTYRARRFLNTHSEACTHRSVVESL